MGSLSGGVIPQGPNRHCGDIEKHESHAHLPNVEDGFASSDHAWCDGIPPLEPFVELVARVPLGSWGFPEDYTHAQVVQAIQDEGIPTFVFDEMAPGGFAKASLRVRWGGVDRVYPVNSMVVQVPREPE
jgi:hypothetical protein